MRGQTRTLSVEAGISRRQESEDGIMTSQEYLTQARRAGMRLTILAARMEWLQSVSCRVTGCWSDAHVKGDPFYSKVETGAVAMADMVADAGKEVEACRDQQRKALALISKLEDDRHKSVLELRYVACLSWPDVAKVMHYDQSWLQRLHKEAIKRLDDQNVSM